MESTGSCTRSTAPAADTSLQSPAIREEGNKLAQQGPTSSRPPAPASRKKAPETIPEFKCLHCPRTFKTARGRGGHLKAHKHRRQVRQNQMEQRRRFALAGQQVRVWSPLLHVPSQRGAYFNFHTQLFNSHYFPSSASRSGVVNLFAGTSTGGGLAPAEPSSAANGYFGIVGGGQVGNGGHLGTLREVNQGETAHGIHTIPSLRSSSVPLFLSQTGSGTSSLPQPLFAAPATAAEGNGGTGDGVHLGGQKQDMPQVNQDETTDGIDLTLRL